MATAVAEGDTGRIAPVRPYGPSWVDRLETLVERLPGSLWVGYVVVAVGGAAVVNGILWLTGSLAPDRAVGRPAGARAAGLSAP
jgi:hypothetical protein